ncbi:MAG TPA: hypothetical protein VLA78_07510 [Paracoccaceae bacterium]|nr:hypothetical protein [Paracoccaceae bacterium]
MVILQVFCSRKLGRVADFDAILQGLPVAGGAA